MLAAVMTHVTFDQDRYIHWQEPGIKADLKLTLGEFYAANQSMQIDRQLSRKADTTQVHILDACRSLRKRHIRPESASCYSVPLATVEHFHRSIEVPTIIKQKSF